MNVSTDQYRAAIGQFNSRTCSHVSFRLRYSLFLCTQLAFLRTVIGIYELTYLSFIFMLLLSGDIETNPGPKAAQFKSLTICHWNLNSLWVDGFAKLGQITAFLTVRNFDIFCISETFLDSTIASDDPRLVLEGYSIIRSDHTSNSKRGGVCIYYKSHLPLVQRSDLTNLDECIVCELQNSRSKRVFITALYRSPSQSSEQFLLFKDKLELTVENINQCSPYLSLLLGDFNVRNSDWWEGDTTNVQGIEINDLTGRHGLHQIIDEPTHLLPYSKSCIDLFFSSATGFIVESGVLPSLYPTCHHQIIFAKVDFKIFFPPPYERRIWDFGKADVDSIRRAMSLIDWDRKFVPMNQPQ